MFEILGSLPEAVVAPVLSFPAFRAVLSPLASDRPWLRAALESRAGPRA
jgi:hypothetical protein